MNKNEHTERDICTKFIVPALEKAGNGRFVENNTGILLQSILKEAFEA